MFTLYRVGKTIRYSGKHSLNLLIYLAVLVLRLVTFLIIPQHDHRPTPVHLLSVKKYGSKLSNRV